MSESSAAAAGRGPLGLWTLTALVIANMIGAGAFTTSGFALGDLGSAGLVLLAWAIGGAVALAGSLSYGALARHLPASGGEYLYLSRTIHPIAGFIAGWVSLLAGFTGAIAYAAITFVAYAGPALAGTAAGGALASALVVVAALLHGIRVRGGARVQTLCVAVKLALIAAFLGYAAYSALTGDWQGLATRPAPVGDGFPLASFALTLMWISFSYSGFNAAIYLAGEVPGAAAVVPRAMLLGTVITTFVYLALNAVFVLAPAFEAVAYQEDVAAIAARVLGGGSLELAVRGIIALALFTSVSAMIMIGPRVYAQMAADGLMPAVLKLEGEVPAAAISAQTALAVVVVWLTELRELLSYLGFTLGLSTAATVATLFVIVRRNPAARAHMPGYPFAPALFVGGTLLLAALGAMRSPAEMLAALATVVSGSLLYLIIERSRK